MKVEGFGWIAGELKRHGLYAEHPSIVSWLDEHFQGPIQALFGSDLFPDHEVDDILRPLERAKGRFLSKCSFLVHGDFDTTHIYYDDSGYTGLIDFGDIRGAHQIYDLGHFSIENGHLLRHLLKGYEEVSPLDEEAQYDIQLTGTLIAARRIGRRVINGRAQLPSDMSFLKRAFEDSMA